MSDQAALNSIVIENLVDLEAATRQIEDVITPMVQDELLQLAADFLDGHPDWTGEADEVADVWFAPNAWRDAAGGEHEYLLYFKLRATAARDASRDAFWLSGLVAGGARKLGLFIVSDRLGDVPLGKLFAADTVLVQKLQGNGFVYDVADRRALYLALTLDREQLVSDLRADDLDAALEPIRRALTAVVASVTLLEPLVGTIRAGA